MVRPDSIGYLDSSILPPSLPVPSFFPGLPPCHTNNERPLQTTRAHHNDDNIRRFPLDGGRGGDQFEYEAWVEKGEVCVASGGLCRDVGGLQCVGGRLLCPPNHRRTSKYLSALARIDTNAPYGSA